MIKNVLVKSFQRVSKTNSPSAVDLRLVLSVSIMCFKSSRVLDYMDKRLCNFYLLSERLDNVSFMASVSFSPFQCNNT